MGVPNITGYRVEEVEVPAPREQRQAILESLKVVPPTPPGPARRMIRITIEADALPITNRPYDIFIGNQRLRALSVEPGGNRATALIEQVPAEGEPIAFHMPAIGEGAGRPAVVLAGNFDTSKLDNRIA